MIDFRELLRLAASSGDYRYAVSEASRWVEKGHYSAGGVTSVLKIYGNANRGDKIEELLVRLGQQQPPFSLNTHHQNACMAAFNRCRKPHRALALFDSIAHPDSYSYASALQAWSKVKVQGALALFESMPPSMRVAVHYNTVMSCVGKDGDWHRSLQLYFDALDVDLADDISHKVIVSALEAAHQSTLASKIKKDCALSAGGGVRTVTRDSYMQYATGVGVGASGGGGSTTSLSTSSDGSDREVSAGNIKPVEGLDELRRLSAEGVLPELSKAGTCSVLTCSSFIIFLFMVVSLSRSLDLLLPVCIL